MQHEKSPELDHTTGLQKILPLKFNTVPSKIESDKDYGDLINSGDAIAVHMICNQKGIMMIGVANGSIYLFNSCPHGCKGASVLMGVNFDIPKFVLKIRQRLQLSLGANFSSCVYHAVALSV